MSPPQQAENPAEPDPEGPKPEDEPEEEAPRAPIGVVPPEQYQATDLVVMEDPEVPLARAGAGYWALVNLIAALLTLLITILLAIVKYVGRDEDEEESDSEEERQTVSTWRLLLSLGITILAAVIFFLTEDLTNTMALVDRWTLLMLIILAVQGIGYYRATHQKEDQDPEDRQPPLPDSV